MSSSQQVDDGVQIAVEDEGPACPSDERELIFDRFSRGARRRPAQRQRASASAWRWSPSTCACTAGAVWVEDRPDGETGARFVVELPVAWT